MFPRKIKEYALLTGFALFCFIYAFHRSKEKGSEGSENQSYQEDYGDDQDINRLGERLYVLEQLCSKATNRGDLNSTAEHIYQDESREILFCSTPGTASAFLLRALALTKFQGDEADDGQLPMVDSIKSTELVKFGIEKVPMLKVNPGDFLVKIDDYFKFLFVRNPYSRILSIYSKNFSPAGVRNDSAIDNFIQTINRKYNRPENSDISFQEFLTYVVDDVTTTSKGFWRPVSDACAPCIIDYDFVGKLETFKHDFSASLEGVQDKSNLDVKIITEKVFNEIESVQADLEDHWRKVPLELVQRFVEAYKKDFSLFGYDISLVSYFKNYDEDMRVE